MGLLDGIKKVTDVAVKTVKYKRREKEIKETMLLRFTLWQLERICVSKRISTKVEGKRGKRRARSKDELIPKLMHLEIEEIAKYAKKFGVKHEDLLEEWEEFKRELNET